MIILALRRRNLPLFTSRRCFSSKASGSEPLRILFCGSDNFSCTSLEALYQEHRQNERLIERLDVMALPPKWAGKGKKELKEVPCKLLAEKLGLRVHQRITFREWEPPEGTNLIVAVSFGLFVPSRILRGAKYGGLNVHPSLLPDLRGPAPLHHALLNGDQYTGVSLQTLDHKNFDHGTVLAQTPAPGLAIPEDATLTSLTVQLAEEGAKMLVQGLRDGLYLPPVRDVTSTAQHEAELRHAPKLAKAESMINWAAGAYLDGATLERRMRGVIQTFGSAWTELVDPYRGNKKRVIFKDVETVRQAPREQGNGIQCRTLKLWGKGSQSEEEDGEGVFTVRTEVEKKTGRVLIYWGGENVWLRIGRATVQGGTEKTADEALKHYLVKEKA